MSSASEAVQTLGRELWDWRRRQQPRSYDDIPRLDRPAGWVPEWSAAAVARARARLDDLEARWRALDVTGAPVEVAVDHRLVGSALARVRWELDVVRAWQRDPSFYVDQTLGTVFDHLLPPPPLDGRRADDLVGLVAAIPETLSAARDNLDGTTVADFARRTVEDLAEVERQVAAVVMALLPLLPDDARRRLSAVADAAAGALGDYRDWLAARLPTLSGHTAVGRDAFVGFLRDVALTPHPPDALLAMGRQEWHRAVALETVAQRRVEGVSPLFASVQEQVAAQREAELAVHRFVEQRGLLSQPAGLRSYRWAPLPDYLAPIAWLGVADDLTSIERAAQDAVRYIPDPSPDLGYFDLANARDPRAGIVHEGVHAQQLALAFAHQDPLRRHYYDSGSNEGIAFYHEELVLQAGLFDDRPDTRATIASFLRLRALRVEVDVRLALGDLDIAGAARYLEEAVPLDPATARQEATFFAATPGQALSYQIGKLQIQRLLSDAVRQQGTDFDLRTFHDWLWRNGNVPLSLLRWELLGLRDDVDALAAPR